MHKDIMSKGVEELKERIETIEKKYNLFSKFLIPKRFDNERLIQIEFMNIILKQNSGIEYLPEKYYEDKPTNPKCDLWFKLNRKEYWIEIKTVVTSYHFKEHSKAISDRKKSVINDGKRLVKYVKKGNRYLLFCVYPLFEDSEKRWNNHLEDIKYPKDIDYKVKDEIETEIGIEEKEKIKIYGLKITR